mmetsp:Transcript_49144/g.100311  ORF Transcript_49144/g.100311 Transcript_49144/m.100311 type:complete len:87 (-) Transcript_49144:383-643(-)|eukprot:CAMPEP_0181298476 /NCGR_PEP_ID=MMETSP1101-20121128/5804_1 /TAXON_ID=46948 /ORGANISM="Rhodomonas abbreviata, Strain Caron Lab Isolate" /LENGTH=86 /DNA_ID=CAMNT_0023403503 /DNA_START=189 /DNA_END=449 /DNA_ORIENTATION=+
MARGKVFTGNRVTRKNSACDKSSHSVLSRSLDKKNGSGKGNWGRLDDQDSVPFLDSSDPSYDPLDQSFEQALREHEQGAVFHLDEL